MYSIFATKDQCARWVGLIDGENADNAWRQIRKACSREGDMLVSVNLILNPHEDYVEEEVPGILLDVEEYLKEGWTVWALDDVKSIDTALGIRRDLVK